MTALARSVTGPLQGQDHGGGATELLATDAGIVKTGATESEGDTVTREPPPHVGRQASGTQQAIGLLALCRTT